MILLGFCNIACLCPNLVSGHFYAIPILHSNFYLLVKVEGLLCFATGLLSTGMLMKEVQYQCQIGH